MKNFRNESELLKPVACYFESKGYNCQIEELQFYEYSIDLYGYSETKDITVSVELKINNWRRAFEQTLIYQLCSDFVFMALPNDKIHRVDRTLLESEGIGLLAVSLNNQCEMIIEPLFSKVMYDNYKRTNIEFLANSRKGNNASC